MSITAHRQDKTHVPVQEQQSHIYQVYNQQKTLIYTTLYITLCFVPGVILHFSGGGVQVPPGVHGGVELDDRGGDHSGC